jgi:sugar/nucleoside kinase (ribokinase family)
MSHANIFDLLTVGHFAIDTISSPKITGARIALGGPPTYVSVAAAKLGAKVAVVSKVGDDFPDEYLKWLHLRYVNISELKRIPNASTTHFALEYKDSRRKMQLQAKAPTISSRDIPSSLRAKIIHVSPIANEISLNAIDKLRKAAEILSLDAQGFVRRFDKEGKVTLRSWRSTEVLDQIDVFKASTDEVQAVTGTNILRRAMKQIGDHGIRIVIVTRGISGSTLLFDKQFYNIPSCKSKIVVDPTGAGDAFIGAFIAEYIHKRDPLWCTCVGSASASFVAEDVGPRRFGKREETYGRAWEIYERQLKSDEFVV